MKMKIFIVTPANTNVNSPVQYRYMPNLLKSYCLYLICMVACFKSFSQHATAFKTSKNFLWGVASAAYQVEGAYQADGKGESKWDFLTNKVGATQFIIGEKQTGNIAINMYDRRQYLKDIQLMKELGVNAYRFSWTGAGSFPMVLEQ